eukprot:5133497-Pyramimonas_sp.AAC.1
MHGLLILVARSIGRRPRGSSLRPGLISRRFAALADPLVAYTGHVAYQWASAVWESPPSATAPGTTMGAFLDKLERFRHPWKVATSPAEAARLT